MSLEGKRRRWLCHNKKCKKQIEAKVGTYFAKQNITFVNALRFMYCWSYELSSVKFCKTHIGCSGRTTVDWSNFMRELCLEDMGDLDNLKIGGPGLCVEVDESQISRRKKPLRRCPTPTMVVWGNLS